MTCEGIYADVQWGNERMEELGNIETGIKGQMMDKTNFVKLISEYKQFKTNYVKHFRFNSAASTSMFGEF